MIGCHHPNNQDKLVCIDGPCKGYEHVERPNRGDDVNICKIAEFHPGRNYGPFRTYSYRVTLDGDTFVLKYNN